jgi:LmbE family N-acetylglucosaminyl deacetylase
MESMTGHSVQQYVGIVIVAVLILGSFLAVVSVVIKALRLRTAIYRYDVSRDQHFDFPQSRTRQITAHLRGGRLDAPPPAQPGDVVLLELKIRSTALGRWFEPYVEIESNQRWRQPIERGGSGLRYIDLSQIVCDQEITLRLTGHHLKIRDQAVVLRYIERHVDLDQKRILVFGTHPDDAEIAAFGVYCDRDAYVVTLTAGEDGDLGVFGRFGASGHLEKGRNRAWNSITVPMLGGLSIRRTANLGYFDGTLTEMKERPNVPVRSLHADAETLGAFGQFEDMSLIEARGNRPATWANLVTDIERLLTAIQPDILVAPYPRLDAHPDHKMSTVALIEALKNLNWRHGSLLLYTNHLCCSDHYPFGDAGDLVALPHGIDNVFFDGIVSNPLNGDKQAKKHMALDAMIDLRPDIRIESPRSLALAFWQAFKAYITDGHTSYFRKAVRANEIFFEVRVSSLYDPGVTDKLIG